MGRYPFIILCLLGGAKETDLIYEGIATLFRHTRSPVIIIEKKLT